MSDRVVLTGLVAAGRMRPSVVAGGAAFERDAAVVFPAAVVLFISARYRIDRRRPQCLVGDVTQGDRHLLRLAVHLNVPEEL